MPLAAGVLVVDWVVVPVQAIVDVDKLEEVDCWDELDWVLDDCVLFEDVDEDISLVRVLELCVVGVTDELLELDWLLELGATVRK